MLTLGHAPAAQDLVSPCVYSGGTEAGIELSGGAVSLTISDAETGEVLLPASLFVETGFEPDIYFQTNTGATTTTVTGGSLVPWTVEMPERFYVLTFAPTGGFGPTVSRVFRYAWQGSTRFSNGTQVGPDFYDPEGPANLQIDSCFKLVAGRMKVFTEDFEGATGSNQFINDYIGGDRWTLPYDAYPSVGSSICPGGPQGCRLGQFLAADVSLDASGRLIPSFYIGRGITLDGSYPQTWQDVPDLRLRFLPGASVVLVDDAELETAGITFEAADPALGWLGILSDRTDELILPGSLTLGPGTSVTGTRTWPALTLQNGSHATLDGARIWGTTGTAPGVLVSNKAGVGGGGLFVTGNTRIEQNAGAGVSVSLGGRATIDGVDIRVQNNGGGLLASGTGSRILMTEGQVLSNTGPAFLATAGGRIDILRDPGHLGGGTSSLVPNTPVVVNNNAGGLYATGTGKSGGVVNSGGEYVCVQEPCPSIGQHNFGVNNVGAAVDARSLGNSAVAAVQNYWAGRSLAQIETDVDASSYIALDPVLNTAPSAAPTGGSARAAAAGAGARGTAPGDATGDAARGGLWTALLGADAHAMAGHADDAARFVLGAYRGAATDDERAAASETAARVLATVQPGALTAWAARAAALPGRDRPWARRALAVALLAQGQPVEAGRVAGALADEDGDASGAGLAHRVRGRWLQVEAAIAAGDASAATAALAALAAVDADAAAALALRVAVAFPDAPAPLAPDALEATLAAGAPVSGVALRVGPNPASDAVTVTLAVPSSSVVAVEVFDALGRSVRQLHDGPSAPSSLTLDADSLPAGLYVVRAVVRHADGTAAVEARTVVVSH